MNGRDFRCLLLTSYFFLLPWHGPCRDLYYGCFPPTDPSPDFPQKLGDPAMKRREMLKVTGAAVLGLSSFPLRWTAAAESRKQKVLYFTRSAGFEHGAVKREGDKL